MEAEDGTDVGDPPFTIEASPAVVRVPQNGSTTVSVAVTRLGGFAEPIEVTIDGLPTGVEQTALLLGSGETTGTITLTAAAAIGRPTPESAKVRGHVSEGRARSAEIEVVVRGVPSSIDTSFGNNGRVSAMTRILDVEEQADRKLLFTGQPDDAAISVCRLNADGAPDLSFGTADGCVSVVLETPAEGQRLTLHQDTILVTGATQRPGIFVARFTIDGALDPTFGEGGVTEIETEDYFWPTAINVIGGIVVAGRIDEPSATAFVTRLRMDGTIDSGFATNGGAVFGSFVLPGHVTDLVRLDDCHFAVTSGRGLHGFDSRGVADLDFGLEGVAELPFSSWSLTRTDDGAILSAGEGMAVARLSASGSIEGSFAPLEPEFGVAHASRIGLGGDGTMILGGSISTDYPYLGMGRRLGDGTPDPDFGTGGAAAYGSDGWAYDVEILRDGRYVLVGTRGWANGVLLRVWD